jgi:hypothetical protein
VTVETELAYLAGVVDSDGCIMVGRQVDHRGGKTTGYPVKVVIVQAEPEAIVLAKKIFGGSIATVQRRMGRPYLQWLLVSKKAALCLSTLLPYLRIKRAQAMNALEAQKSTDKYVTQRKGSRRPDDVTAMLEWHWQESKRLNHVIHQFTGA